jgi:hypothetical protein
MRTGSIARTAVGAVLAAAMLLAGAACSSSSAEKAPAAYTGDAASDILEAVRTGDTATVGRLLDENPDLLNTRDNQGFTLLHRAVLSNQAGVVDLLIDRGMDPNVLSAGNLTPLGELESNGMRAEEAREAIIARGGVG